MKKIISTVAGLFLILAPAGSMVSAQEDPRGNAQENGVEWHQEPTGREIGRPTDREGYHNDLPRGPRVTPENDTEEDEEVPREPPQHDVGRPSNGKGFHDDVYRGPRVGPGNGIEEDNDENREDENRRNGNQRPRGNQGSGRGGQ
jgi:hypothetical protein